MNEVYHENVVQAENSAFFTLPETVSDDSLIGLMYLDRVNTLSAYLTDSVSSPR